MTGLSSELWHQGRGGVMGEGCAVETVSFTWVKTTTGKDCILKFTATARNRIWKRFLRICAVLERGKMPVTWQACQRTQVLNGRAFWSHLLICSSTARSKFRSKGVTNEIAMPPRPVVEGREGKKNHLSWVQFGKQKEFSCKCQWKVQPITSGRCCVKFSRVASVLIQFHVAAADATASHRYTPAG